MSTIPGQSDVASVPKCPAPAIRLLGGIYDTCVMFVVGTLRLAICLALLLAMTGALKWGTDAMATTDASSQLYRHLSECDQCAGPMAHLTCPEFQEIGRECFPTQEMARSVRKEHGEGQAFGDQRTHSSS